MVAADSSPAQPGAAAATALRHEQRQQEQDKALGDNGRAPLAAVSEKCNNTGGGVRKAKNREITSRYKSASTASTAVAPPSSAASQSAASRRHPSPNLGRALSADASPVTTKRAVSAERRRAWPTPEPKSPASPAESPWPGPKTRISARGPELLWPSSQGQRTSSEGLPNGNAEPKRSPAGERSPSASSQGSLRPASNGHRSVPSPLQRRESPMRRQSGGDHAENARPDLLRSKPELQRWPGSTNGKALGPAALTRSVDLGSDRGRPAPTPRSVGLGPQGRPVTSSGYGLTSGSSGGGSNSATPRPRPTASSLIASARNFSRSVNEGPPAPAPPTGSRSSTPDRRNRARVEPTPAKPLAERPRSGSASREVRKSVQETVLAGSDSYSAAGDNVSDSESVSSGGSAAGSRASSARGTIVPARVWQAPEAASRRRLSEANRLRSSMSEQDATKAVRKGIPPGTSPSASTSSSAWSLSSARGIMPISSAQPPSSPARGRAGSSPLRGLPSPTRTRPTPPPPLNGTIASRMPTSALNFGTDLKSRGKKAMSQHEEALLLRVLHNRYLQWRYINARADTALTSQRISAEKSMYGVWMRTSQLRSSVATQRIRLQQAKHFHKLKSILAKQAPQLHSWSALKQDHATALFGVVEALEASILRVPVTGGARADVQAVKDALGSAVDVMNAVELSVKNLLPKAQTMDALVAQLADTAAQERAVLAECGDLLSTAAALEIEERSLTTHLVQIQHERIRQAASPHREPRDKSFVNATTQGFCPT